MGYLSWLPVPIAQGCQNQEIDSFSIPSLLLWSFTLGGKVLREQTLLSAKPAMFRRICIVNADSIVSLHTGMGSNVFQACALHWHLIDKGHAVQC